MASIQHLTEIAGGKHAILEQAAADPKIAKKRKPDQDQVSIAVLKVVEKRAIAGAADLVREDLQEALDAYVHVADERFMSEDPDDWDSSLDDLVEEVFSPYNDVLSADFLATHTIDTKMHEENGVERIANAFGKEVYKQLCWQAGTADVPGKIKQPMQILSSAGILTSDILGYFADRLPTLNLKTPVEPTPTAEPTENEVAAINDLIRRMLAAGVTADTADLEVLGNLVDSDDTLAAGAAQQVGLDADDAVAFQMLALDMDEAAAVAHIVALLAELGNGYDYVEEPAYVEPVPELVGDEEEPYDFMGDGATPAVVAVPAPPASTPAVGLNEALKLFMDHGGTGAADGATLVGVSRQTFNNYLNSKSEWKPDDEAKGRVLDEIERHMTGLDRARALLGGA